ncbi:MAG: bifunctional phosphopantothenoylcysteine decarboxylase/phosphopantothenate--cysteine ligase CoaBC [Cellvibrionales bacterium]|nr:bifunctional phosphopantothenoylcysteine decarboxylase/phosphopantothenate--cysteine ligase CoaBC [Cellvibrionales bacterium]
MSSLSQKRIILGITGGIAAYKSAEITRRLQDEGAEVRVVMSESAQEFIRPLTLQALSGNPVHTDLLDPEAEAAMGHIELARWADIVLIAPATANFVATLNQGSANDLMSSICLATTAPVMIAPAMNQAMWSNSASQQNIESLKQREVIILEPDNGIQACGDVGPGRLPQPETIVRQVASVFKTGEMTGKKVVITAGPTREAIDPVRYVSNHSSGKMGYAIADAMIDAGADVTLISGPVSLKQPDRCTLVSVTSAHEMLEAATEAAKGTDIFISAAAVADYYIPRSSDQKIKKKSDKMTLNLAKTPDIVSIVKENNPKLFVLGFAAETQNVEQYAREKLASKNLDAIIANDVSREDIGFNSDDNEALWVEQESTHHFSKCNKAQLARDLVALLATKLEL